MGRNCQYLPPILPCPQFNISLTKVKTLWGYALGQVFQTTWFNRGSKSSFAITYNLVLCGGSYEKPSKKFEFKVGL